MLPTAGWIPGFSARSRQHAWHSCRAGCIVTSENPQGLANHITSIHQYPFPQVKKNQRFQQEISYIDVMQDTDFPLIWVDSWPDVSGGIYSLYARCDCVRGTKLVGSPVCTLGCHAGVASFRHLTMLSLLVATRKPLLGNTYKTARLVALEAPTGCFKGREAAP